MGPELHDGRDDLGGDLREFGDERRGERLLHLRLVLLEAAGAFGDVEALPSTYNLKPNHCSSHGHLARGAVRFLHWKDKTRTKRRAEVCSIVNANVSARLILGLSKCGMHGEEPVRLKRLKRPWVDQD